MFFCETLKILLQVFSQNLDLVPAKINKKSIGVRFQSDVRINCKIEFRKVFTNDQIGILNSVNFVDFEVVCGNKDVGKNILIKRNLFHKQFSSLKYHK